MKACIARTKNKVLVRLRGGFKKSSKKSIAEKICAIPTEASYKLNVDHIKKIESHDKGLVLSFSGATQMKNLFETVKKKKVFASNLYEMNGEEDYEIKFLELTECYNVSLEFCENETLRK